MSADDPQMPVGKPANALDAAPWVNGLTAEDKADAPASIPAGSIIPYLELLTLLALVVTVCVTALVMPSPATRELLSPSQVALLLVANLLPAMALLVLVGRRIARRRARARGGEARMHTRLVALFSLTAAAPTMLVVIIASFLFQSGMDFWFSDRSRGMFENAVSVAQNFFENEKRDVSANALAMATDLRAELEQSSIESDRFYDFYVQQVVVRELSESAIIEVGRDGIARTAALIDPDNRAAEARITPAIIAELRSGTDVVTSASDDGVDAVVQLMPERRIYLYAARGTSVFGIESPTRARSVFADYNALFARSLDLQFRFILALYVGSLVLIALVIVVAIWVADRIVRPIDELVSAARRVTAGDLETRVRSPAGKVDEVAMLAQAFNQMTARLGEQTRDLLFANEQIENRRLFIEAVLSAVASGVVSLDRDQKIRLVNAAAVRMFRRDEAALLGQPLTDAVPELAQWATAPDSDPILSLSIAGEPRTWVAKVSDDEHGHVITFEDITQQLFDQRKAAWSDVARRIAHEIKNPLTPIQLAAERLQRRFGKKQGEGGDVFGKLTSTIVRQVGDLRRIVDEFSSFAQMPRPTFREENIGEIIRQSLFLHEVSRPDIRFEAFLTEPPQLLVCDRRLMAQAFTNLIKNAVEAIDAGKVTNGHIAGVVGSDGNSVLVSVIDNGIGLPGDRDSIVEPYVTTRDGGTGLGLAIVKKIVEEHGSQLEFTDRPGGGTVASIRLWPDVLRNRSANHDALWSPARREEEN